ncbi:hypothetical protein Acy02nite_08050 [Actinoplanes cyaneus]|uniref:Uncharacterized protein n=1 Tax=Actinoplanes cyaneus TaxID=52696 RepID=A0A919ICC8_9ACTN|nr:hypothetical protein [Actinoplanes cyaneus]MCW2135713.1 hypothetical protein [Actinoplanes cyaneus]GID62924.1 hypothetical protein Acy02nite_08050 [Actinoplanes cyaneus]
MRLRPAPGTVTAEDREWQARARRLTLDSLHDVRAVAGRWAATIGSLTGLLSLVALVAGPRSADQLPVGWRVVAGLCVLAAIGCAGCATWFAAEAAQGSIGSVLSTYAQVRDLFRKQEAVAVRLLGRAKILVVVAMGALVVAVALTWFVPKESSDYLVIRRGAEVSCVPLKDGLALSLALDAASTVTVAKRCPAR